MSDVAYPDAVLTPCRDEVGRGGEQCAHECSCPNNAEHHDFLGGYFHLELLPSCPICERPDYACGCTPQQRTAHAHAKLAAEERIRAKTREYERRTIGGYIEFLKFNMPSPEEWVREYLRTEPSDPGTTMPPQLDP